MFVGLASESGGIMKKFKALCLCVFLAFVFTACDSNKEETNDVEEKAMDECIYEGKTIRQWVEVLKDYDDKKTIVERILERLEEIKTIKLKEYAEFLDGEDYRSSLLLDEVIEIVKEEGGL